MKKTIASIAMMVSASTALSMPIPRGENEPKPVLKTVCMDTYKLEDGSVRASNCNSIYNNERLGKEVKQNGCAEDQISIQSYEEIAIKACMPVGMAQL